MKKIALIAEYNPESETHIATERAIQDSVKSLGIQVEHQWVSTSDVSESLLSHFDGIWLGTGSPYKDMNRALWAIKYAREQNVPLLGTCGGFQHVIIEIARNILGFQDAEHAEYDPYSSKLFISELTCSLAGKVMDLDLIAGSNVAKYYGTTKVKEKYYCNFGVNPEYIEKLKMASIDIVGSDSLGEIRIIEIPTHRFFVATLFVPQASSTSDYPHPLVTRFIDEVANN